MESEFKKQRKYFSFAGKMLLINEYLELKDNLI